MSLGQIVDEDRIDPFPLKTTVELEELVEACRRTKEILSRETLIYSRTADFSMYGDQELAAMNAFVRETARMLSVVLAGGREHFFNGQGMSMVQELQKMELFIDGKVKEFLLVDKLIETLGIKEKYGRKTQTSKEKTSPISNHPDVSIFASVDAAKGATSPESLQKLAEICERFAGQCREVSKIRYEKCIDRTRTLDARESLQSQVEELMPLLRQHVLRIGLTKSTSNGRHENTGTVIDHSRLMTSIFTHQAVTEAHRAVEDCRERLLQETLFRKQKAEKRMEREFAREEALRAARERDANSPGRSPSQAGYLARGNPKAVEGSADTIARKSLSRNLSMAKRPSQSPPRALWNSQRSAEGEHSHSPEKEKKEKKEKKSKKREDDSPDSGRKEKKEKKDKGKASSRSQSPRESMTSRRMLVSSQRK
jgi:hypothetical protein